MEVVQRFLLILTLYCSMIVTTFGQSTSPTRELHYIGLNIQYSEDVIADLFRNTTDTLTEYGKQLIRCYSNIQNMADIETNTHILANNTDILVVDSITLNIFILLNSFVATENTFINQKRTVVDLEFYLEQNGTLVLSTNAIDVFEGNCNGETWDDIYDTSASNSAIATFSSFGQPSSSVISNIQSSTLQSMAATSTLSSLYTTTPSSYLSSLPQFESSVLSIYTSILPSSQVSAPVITFLANRQETTSSALSATFSVETTSIHPEVSSSLSTSSILPSLFPMEFLTMQSLQSSNGVISSSLPTSTSLQPAAVTSSNLLTLLDSRLGSSPTLSPSAFQSRFTSTIGAGSNLLFDSSAVPTLQSSSLLTNIQPTMNSIFISISPTPSSSSIFPTRVSSASSQGTIVPSISSMLGQTPSSFGLSQSSSRLDTVQPTLDSRSISIPPTPASVSTFRSSMHSVSIGIPNTASDPLPRVTSQIESSSFPPVITSTPVLASRIIQTSEIAQSSDFNPSSSIPSTQLLMPPLSSDIRASLSSLVASPLVSPTPSSVLPTSTPNELTPVLIPSLHYLVFNITYQISVTEGIPDPNLDTNVNLILDAISAIYNRTIAEAVGISNTSDVFDSGLIEIRERTVTFYVVDNSTFVPAFEVKEILDIASNDDWENTIQLNDPFAQLAVINVTISCLYPCNMTSSSSQHFSIPPTGSMLTATVSATRDATQPLIPATSIPSPIQPMTSSSLLQVEGASLSTVSVSQPSLLLSTPRTIQPTVVSSRIVPVITTAIRSINTESSSQTLDASVLSQTLGQTQLISSIPMLSTPRTIFPIPSSSRVFSTQSTFPIPSVSSAFVTRTTIPIPSPSRRLETQTTAPIPSSSRVFATQSTTPIPSVSSAFVTQTTTPTPSAPSGFATQATLPISNSSLTFVTQTTIPTPSVSRAFTTQVTIPLSSPSRVFSTQSTIPIPSTPIAFVTQTTIPTPSVSSAFVTQVTTPLSSPLAFVTRTIFTLSLSPSSELSTPSLSAELQSSIPVLSQSSMFAAQTTTPMPLPSSRVISPSSVLIIPSSIQLSSSTVVTSHVMTSSPSRSLSSTMILSTRPSSVFISSTLTQTVSTLPTVETSTSAVLTPFPSLSSQTPLASISTTSPISPTLTTGRDYIQIPDFDPGVGYLLLLSVSNISAQSDPLFYLNTELELINLYTIALSKNVNNNRKKRDVFNTTSMLAAGIIESRSQIDSNTLRIVFYVSQGQPNTPHRFIPANESLETYNKLVAQEYNSILTDLSFISIEIYSDPILFQPMTTIIVGSILGCCVLLLLVFLIFVVLYHCLHSTNIRSVKWSPERDLSFTNEGASSHFNLQPVYEKEMLPIGTQTFARDFLTHRTDGFTYISSGDELRMEAKLFSPFQTEDSLPLVGEETVTLPGGEVNGETYLYQSRVDATMTRQVDTISQLRSDVEGERKRAEQAEDTLNQIMAARRKQHSLVGDLFSSPDEVKKAEERASTVYERSKRELITGTQRPLSTELEDSQESARYWRPRSAKVAPSIESTGSDSTAFKLAPQPKILEWDTDTAGQTNRTKPAQLTGFRSVKQTSVMPVRPGTLPKPLPPPPDIKRPLPAYGATNSNEKSIPLQSIPVRIVRSDGGQPFRTSTFNSSNGNSVPSTTIKVLPSFNPFYTTAQKDHTQL